MKKLSFILFGVILLCAGCRKDKLVITETVILGEDPATYVNTSITGVVVDENDIPVQNAFVSNDKANTQTDDNGFFYLKDISANKNGAVVQVQKAGYFSTSQTVFPKLNSVEFIKIKLLSSKESGIISGDQGGSVTLPQGASISLPDNGVTLNGQPYSGDVHVHATFIDPLADDIFERMPGSLLGVDTDGRVMGMATFGMMGVELYADNGALLQIAPDKKAELVFPLPDEILNEAPSEIKLWHYDLDLGYWIEEGVAILSGNQYVAEVSHFSFWNCDDPFETVNLEGRVVTENGDPVSNVTVVLRRNTATNNTGYANTAADGTYRGKIPKDEMLKMEVSDACGNVVLTQDIGPFSVDTRLGNIVVDLPQEVNISGVLLDCNNAPVELGYLMVLLDENVVGYLTPNDKGEFSGAINYCKQGEIKFVGVDLAGGQKSDESIAAFSPSIDLGNVVACGTIVPTFTIEYDGETYILGNANGNTYIDTAGGSKTYTSIGGEDVQGYLTLGVQGEGVGTYPVEWISARLNGSSNAQFTDPRIDVTFTYFGDVDDHIVGTFSGMIYDNIKGVDANISGHFRVLRN